MRKSFFLLIFICCFSIMNFTTNKLRQARIEFAAQEREREKEKKEKRKLQIAERLLQYQIAKEKLKFQLPSNHDRISS